MKTKLTKGLFNNKSKRSSFKTAFTSGGKKNYKGRKRRSSKNSKFLFIIVAILIIAAIIYILIPEKEEPLVVDMEMEVFPVEYILPDSPYKEQIVERSEYTLGYNESTEQPNWVAYRITRENLLNPQAERSDDFKEDKSIITGSASLADYRGSGYDRGHLAPAADFKHSELAMEESFYMSNMSPQKGAFNRDIWADLESAVRKNAFESGVLYVVTGPLFYDYNIHERIGENGVAVPDAYYKALLVCNNKEKKAIAFILPHEDLSDPLFTYTTTIDELEEISGIDFFPLLEDELEEELESSFNPKEWTFSLFWPPTKEEVESKSYRTTPSSDYSFYETKQNLKNIKRHIRSLLGLDK